LTGLGKLPRKRRNKQREVCEAIPARTDGLDRVSHREEWPSWLGSMVTMNRNLGSLPMVGGNSAELIESYQGSIQAMADAIDRAQHFVQVRVLSDHVAQFMYPNRNATLRRFAAIRAEYQPMLPLQPLRGHWRRPDLRNHRKLVVADGRHQTVRFPSQPSRRTVV
jgi:cardiolipin synthase